MRKKMLCGDIAGCYHNYRELPYQMFVVSSHNESVGRKLGEGVNIWDGNQDILLNSKEHVLQGAVSI